MRELLPLIIIVAGLVLVGLPMFLMSALGEDAELRYDPFDPSRHPAPPEIAAFIRDNVAGLASEQFKQVGDLVRAGPIVTTRVVLLEHPSGAVATIALAYAAQGHATVMVEFTAEMTGGRMLDVNNLTSPPLLLPVRPGHETHRFPDVRDPARLYRVFEALLRRRFGSATLRQRDIASDPARFLAAISEAEYRDRVAAGYFRYDERTHRYRPKLRGAYLLWLGSLPPFKQLRSAAMRRRAHATLRELNLDQPDARPVQPVASVTPVAEPTPPEPTPPEPTSRSSPFEWVTLIGGMILLFASAFAVERWTGSSTLTVGVIVVIGPLGLWLVMRHSLVSRARKAGGDARAIARAHQNANRVALPLLGFGAVLLVLTGTGEIRGRRAARLPDLVVPAEFPAAIRTLGQLTGQPVTQLAGHDSLYVVEVRSRWANRFLRAAHDKYAAQQFFLSRFDLYFRNDTTAVRVLLAPVGDPYEVLRLVGTHETNGRTTAEIAEGLQSLDREAPFELLNVGEHWARGVFAGEVSDAARVVDRLGRLCPLTLERQFRGDVQAQAETIQRVRGFTCVWS